MIIRGGGHTGKGVRRPRLGALGTSRSALLLGRLSEVADRLRAARRGQSAVPDAVLQPRVLREPDRTDEVALGHLRRAIEMSEEFRDSARSDSDLDAIRDEPEFQELTSQAGW